MPIEAINIASSGLMRSEKRAAELANSIVNGFAGELNSTANSDGDTNNEAPLVTNQQQADDVQNSGYLDRNPYEGATNAGASYATVIQDIVDLKTNEHSYKANAAVFKRASEMADELGRLLDDEG